MKMHILVLILAIAAANASTEKDLWSSFKADHGKTYKNVLEEQQRYRIFQDNLRKIEEHNEKFENGEETYKMGITQFSDLTSTEFRNLFKRQRAPPVSSDTFYASPDVQLPENFDWRKEEPGAVPELRTQYYCAAYYAMSAVSAVESQVFLKYKKKVRLSEQEIIDCSVSYKNAGCIGGINYNAFNYIVDNGVAFNEDYPFKRYMEVCKNTTIPKSNITVTGYGRVQYANETAVQQALVAHGPLSTMFFDEFSQHYVSGIVNIKYCPMNLYDMSGLIVGYGVENNTDYWTVQAYYGGKWGENGYFRLLRNKLQCGIANEAIYAIIQ